MKSSKIWKSDVLCVIAITAITLQLLLISSPFLFKFETKRTHAKKNINGSFISNT